jgi:dTDP-4-dehydrorhamnose 3,5-epimerase
MKLTETRISGLIIIEPKVLNDSRGYFFEPYNKERFDKNIEITNFVQDNESKSSKGVLRGFHFQKPPYDQAKLVRCIEGKVLDIALDLRKKSSTYGKYEKVILSGENKKQFFIPRGFAHAFLVLSKTALFSYKVDNIYAPEFDSGVIWNDIDLSIDWPFEKSDLIISDKDKSLSPFTSIQSPF